MTAPASIVDSCVAGNVCSFSSKAILPALLGALAGCAGAPKAAPGREYIVAARFGAGQTNPTAADASAVSMDSQLRGLRTRGFNTVVLDHVDDSSRTSALATAAQCGLRAYITDRELHDFLLTGRLRNHKNLDEYARDTLQPLAGQEGFGGVALMAGYPAEQASALLNALEAAGIPAMIPGQSGYAAHHAATVSWLDAQRISHSGVSPVERLLLEFHNEVYSGWNDGVVVDLEWSAAKKDSGDDSGDLVNDTSLAESPDIPTASGPKAMEFAIDYVLRRARLWGAKLRDCQQVALLAPDAPADSLRTALYYRGGRRFLLLFNQSSEPARRTIRFATMLAGRPVVRAVEIPTVADRLAGQVIPARHGELAIAVDLRPGDAALYELF